MATIESNYADFHRAAFSKFMQSAGVLDRNIHTGIVDTYFVATNYDRYENDNNDKHALLRFEFLEILIRIAHGKYI